jgi:tetratricopeptide (TPR) repeat protein
LLFVAVLPVRAQPACSPILGRVVSVQGTVEVQRTGADWKPAALEAGLCAGDAVRVGTRSRAALLLGNETTLRLDQDTTLVLASPTAPGRTLLEQVRGALHVISRTPRPFAVRTPFVNANVEGTEFAVLVSAEEARIAVFEGRVAAENVAGRVDVREGEEARANRNGPPSKAVMIRPDDAIVWTLYAPAVLDDRPPAGVEGTPSESAWRQAAALRSNGRSSEALALLEAIPQRQASAGLQIYQAGLFMEVGRFPEARESLDRALKLEPRSADARALLAIMRVVLNDKQEALRLASDAVAANPASAVAQTALSYAQQASFNLDAAVASQRAAVALDVRNPHAWARLSELVLSQGRLAEATEAAEKAASIDPAVARAQTVLGFAQLSRLDTQRARQAFEKAIALDSTEPLARLGLGLAKVRDGSLVAGREEIEIAISLDPGRSLVRSYLGKAYFDELRAKLAETQFDEAKRLDPQDSTPFHYGGIAKQDQNRLVEALEDLTRALELNDRRLVSRSKLLVDQDAAVRQVSRARTYQGLGFDELALEGAYRAVTTDFSDFSAHGFLADAYDALPRLSIASQSEALQAQLRSPVVQPTPEAHFLGDTSFRLRTDSFFPAGFGEYGSLFETNGTRAYADATAGNLDTLGQRVFVGGLAGRVSYAFSETTYRTDGFETRSAVDKSTFDALVRGQLAPGSTLTAYFRRTDQTIDTTFYPFDPVNGSSSRIDDRQDLFRIGGRQLLVPGTDFVWSATRVVDHQSSRDYPDLILSSEEEAKTSILEAQLVHTLSRVQLVAGAGAVRSDEDFTGGSTIETHASSVYAYGRWDAMPKQLVVLAGLASERFHMVNSLVTGEIARNRVSPKLGLAWTPHPDVSFRAAGYEGVRRPLIGGQTLEPTSFNGFNQVYSGINELFGDQDGTVSKAASFALDARPAQGTFAGLSYTKRRLTVPSLAAGQDFPWRDSTGTAYLYHALSRGWTSPWQAGASLEYRRETFDRPQDLTGPEGIIHLRNDEVRARLRMFHPDGWSFGASLLHFRQSGSLSVDTTLPVYDQSSKAWLVDLNGEYRLPRRLGAIQLGVRNLTDRRFVVVDTDPLRPRFATRRMVFLTVQLAT